MIEVSRYKLSNGLRIVHNRNAATQMAAFNLLYCVGSRNESPEHTGLAHLLEHLMFGGSENARSFDMPLQEACGENNAWTTADITNYYEVLPVCNIETAFWLESDRMCNLLLDERSLSVQRSVVAEEFKQRVLNVPYGDLTHIWRDLAYKVHPYRWPVIGLRVEDIENMPAEIVRDFYKKYYAPDNAILSVVGNIHADEVFKMAEKWFGGISSYSAGRKDSIEHEPEQQSGRAVKVNRDVPGNVLLRAYHICGRLDADYPACDLLSDVLANGRSSRFFRNIFAKGGLVSSIDASVTGELDAGVLLIKAQLLQGVSFDAVEKAIDLELEKVIEGDVSDGEIKKNANRFESNHLFSNINNDERASNLAYYEMLGDADMINLECDRYKNVSGRKLAEVAGRVLRKENCSTVYYESNLV